MVISSKKRKRNSPIWRNSNFETMECHGRFTPKMVISSEKRELFQEEGFHEKKHMVKPCMTKKTFTLFNENCMNGVNSL